jgi:glycosyltransferase involved in cell wall biosynthesis
MRIIYQTFARFPSKTAHTVNIMKMCQSMKKNGCDLTLVADVQKSAEEVFSYYSIRRPFKTIPIKCPRIRVLGRILFLMKTFSLLRKDLPDLFFTRDVFNASLVKIFNLPFVFEIHETPGGFIQKYLLKRILKNEHLVCLIIISEKLKKILDDEFGPLIREKKWIIAHDGVDLEDFALRLTHLEARKEVNLPTKPFIAGYTGSLFKGRGPAEVILKVAAQLRNILFVVVGGENKYITKFKKEVKILRLRNVMIKGAFPHNKIPLFLQSFDVLLMPYQQKVLHRQKKHETSSYMSPLKMFEYMASGKPIIASRLEVIEEVLKDKKNALLVASDNIHEWAESIRLLKEDRFLAKRLGEQAKEDVKIYTWDERVQNIFSMILNSGGMDRS